MISMYVNPAYGDEHLSHWGQTKDVQFIHKLPEKTAMTVWIAETWHMLEHYFHGCGITEIKGALIHQVTAATIDGTFNIS